MTLLNVLETLSEYDHVTVKTMSGKILSTYDGKNSINDSLNDKAVLMVHHAQDESGKYREVVSITIV